MSLTSSLTRTAWRSLTALVLTMGLAPAAWPAAGVAAQADMPLTAEAAPDSTVLFHTTDLDRDGSQWQLTEELLARVGLPDALDLWDEALLEEAAATGEDFTQADLDALLGGEAAIVVTEPAVEWFAAKYASRLEGDVALDAADATPVSRSSDDPLGVVGILVPGDPDAAWDYVQRQFAALATEREVSLEESTYGGAELLWIAGKDRAKRSGRDHDNPMDEWMGKTGLHGRGGLAAARSGEFIVAGVTEADVTGIIDVIDGTVPSLADSAEAQAVAAELPAEALSFTYMDGPAILDALGPEIVEAWASYTPNMAQETWRAHAGLAIGADSAGFRVDMILLPGEGGSLDAMAVENDPNTIAAAERAPADAFIFEAGVLPEEAFADLPYPVAQGVNGTFESGEMDGDWQMQEPPTPEEIEAEIAQATATLGFNPAADLFDLLGGDFIVFANLPDFMAGEFIPDAVAAISTSDPAVLADTAEKMVTLIESSEEDAVISERSVGSDTVYVLTDPTDSEFPAIEFGVVDGQAVIGMGGGIDDLVTTPDPSLADDPQFQTVMDHLPGEYYQVAYVDIGQAIAPLVMMFGMMDESAVDSSDAAATPVLAAGGLENIRALGAVAFKRGEMAGSSAILYISEPES